MKYINEIREGNRMNGVYLCKHRQSAVTKNGKSYENVILQDKTGTMDAKIWEPNSVGIEDFDTLDYVDIVGDVTSFAGSLQVSIKRARKVKEGEYNPADYLPASKFDIEEMYAELMQYAASVKDPYLSQLLKYYYVNDAEFINRFKNNSAAKTVHHGFIGGLLQHTLCVVRLCDYYVKAYPILNRDLLITAAIFHDIGKTKELSAFPQNDYTDDGQLLGHIMIGAEMIHDAVRTIPGFPEKQENELKHCILAHHGELEYGSPKKPALAEALALNMADNTDAKLETLTEVFDNAGDSTEWLGYNRLFESNLRKTTEF
ncbi:MAG: HD domain-containing protein [Lachnospiraceae bacterium]|nr:HD domain-containing protein [Lachnospiraceae bacterium]